MDDAFRSVMEASQRVFEQANPAIEVFEALGEYVKEFEENLDDDHELGANLVSFGSSLQIRVERIGYSIPNLITFSGRTLSGDPVKLIQHISQLSFLLVGVKKEGEKARRIGFIWDDA